VYRVHASTGIIFAATKCDGTEAFASAPWSGASVMSGKLVEGLKTVLSQAMTVGWDGRVDIGREHQHDDRLGLVINGIVARVDDV
jgi:hypothetical protein